MTMEDLEKRVAALEQEVGMLRQLFLPRPGGETPAEAAARTLRLMELEAPAVEAAWAKAMEELGIQGLQPIGAEKLQEMLAAQGIKPEDNEFSRELIAMRECSRPPLPKGEE